MRKKIFTPEQFKKSREKLGLTQKSMARMLGFEGQDNNLAQSQNHLESGTRRIREVHRRLMESYVNGYRPPDWPHED